MLKISSEGGTLSATFDPTALRDAIVPLVDPRPLCAPDCAGLCDVCGEKWADLPEDHDHFVVDPRLASLASLLGEDSESGRS